ncbi:hypothetical protein ACQEU5_24875 [Marinactinospora thermotolerans]|uniref:hypothetical protein n=1 Tax=Marinactinospora thermotolerans TaxID=531310 RepID=UPI003D8D8695
MTPRISHAPYTAAVQRALVDAGHVPELVRTVEEQTGLRRSLVRVGRLRLLWEEEKGWSAAVGAGESWRCPHGVVAPPEQVADWVGRVLAGDRFARGVEHGQIRDSELEEALTAYVDPLWLAGPPPETDPAWT